MTSHNPYLKRRETLVIGKEATRGVAGTPTYAFRWLNKTLTTLPGIIENESGVGDDNRVNDSAIAVNHAEGTIGGKITNQQIAYMERWIMPVVTTTNNGDGTYTHEFTYSPTTEGVTYSVWDIRPSTTRLYKSCVLDNLELTAEAGESGAWVEASAAVKGWKHENVSPVTPSFDLTEKEFTNRHVKIYLADDEAGLSDLVNARVKARRWVLAREQTRPVDHSLGDGDTPEFDKSPFEAKGELVIKYRKTDYEEGYFSNKQHAMKVVIQDGDDKIEYIGTKVRFRELTDSDGRDEVVTQQISYIFEADYANGGHAIKVRVTNNMATI